MLGVLWPHLEKLDIKMTQVIGPLPTSFASTYYLVYFQADGYSIDGPIFFSIESLKFINLVSQLQLPNRSFS